MTQIELVSVRICEFWTRSGLHVAKERDEISVTFGLCDHGTNAMAHAGKQPSWRHLNKSGQSHCCGRLALQAAARRMPPPAQALSSGFLNCSTPTREDLALELTAMHPCIPIAPLVFRTLGKTWTRILDSAHLVVVGAV